MSTVGIVSEYNPFHNGHMYHIHTAKSECNADSAVCVMSGSFVQRGEPAIYDKWTRTKMALYNGADLVIELPVLYSCQPAEVFAYGAVKILDSLGIVDSICFGSENGNTELLIELAKILFEEPDLLKAGIKKALKAGVNYPKAVSEAFNGFDNITNSNSKLQDILLKPNNTLAIEYIKSLLKLKSKIKPIAVKRIYSEYNEEKITGGLASATAIRKEIKAVNRINDALALCLPESVIWLINEYINTGKNPIYSDAFSDILLYKIRTTPIEQLMSIVNSKEGIEYRIKKSAESTGSFEALAEMIKTKRYTRTYIQRLLCHIMLGFDNSSLSSLKDNDNPIYIRVLGMNKKGKALLKTVKEKCPYPIITKAADFKTDDMFLNEMFEYDTRSTDIYNLGFKNAKFRIAGSDFLTSPVID